ncbi:MAG: outer membrane lipid asymmetry maintenance protein MlaD [Mariprofundaceae bacterium]|nr:outer membrane lipid asymmetry maintenance protein MlaD [Mariprofundaceae bacterium]
MTEYKKIEMIVGAFVLAGIISISWMAVKLGQIGGMGASGYALKAVFTDAGGMRSGSDVMMAGVVIGRVDEVVVNERSQARLTLLINDGIPVTSDAIASVRTKGIIGERYVRISQGGDDELLQAGDEIEETESAINIEDLVSKYIFSSGEK